MPARPLAYNLLRLILASIHTTPRGVDRIDYGYLSYLLDHWPGELYGVMPTLIGLRFFSRRQILSGRARLDHLWRETSDPAQDAALGQLINWFETGKAPSIATKPRGFLPDIKGVGRMAKLVFGGEISLGKPITDLPQGAIYLDVGHYGLTFPRAFRWRKQRPDVHTVFMVHDTIPLEYPEFVADETFRAHQRLMTKTSKYADKLIVPTHSASRAVREALLLNRAKPLDIHPISLPIDDLFQPDVEPVQRLKGQSYFVICGAIEPRKNHRLLFEVWRELVRRHEAKAPKLVIAGSPGHASAEIIQELQQDMSLKSAVVISTGLSSPALAQVVAGARALLMPSFVEGFGLPPAEALAMGTPALVSDIPAHREAVGEFGVFLPPKNPEAWIEAIEALANTSFYKAHRAAIRSFKPTRWPGYMATVTEILRKT